MALYRLKKVKLNRDGKKYGPKQPDGDVVDLNKTEAEVMAWGIERVGYHDPDEDEVVKRRDIPSAKSETPSQMAAREKGMEGTDADSDDDTDTEHDLDLTVLEGNALSVKEYINTLDDHDQLKALRKAEVSGKDRTGVVNAIDARMEELTT